MATGPISVGSNCSSEYDPGFITGDEPLNAHGIESNIASIFVEFSLCICLLHVVTFETVTGPSEPSSDEEEILFYGPPTLAEHRAVLFMNRFLQPELPPDLGVLEPTEPPDEPQPEPFVEAPPGEAPTAAPLQPHAVEGG